MKEEDRISKIPDELRVPIQGFISRNWTLILIIISLMLGYISIIFLGKDNLLEEEIEKVISAETGVKIDLTPF